MGCETCRLKGSKQIPYKGNTNADVVFMLESPGMDELAKGYMLAGKTGIYVQKECNRVGLNFDELFFMNAARCMINKDKLTDGQIGKILNSCYDYVETALETVKPKLIVCMGAIALAQVYKKMAIKKARNQFFWSDKFNCHIFTTYHPAAIMRDPKKQPFFQADFNAIAKFIKNGYESKEEIIYKEVESIRPILDGDCHKEGNYYVTGIDTETQGTEWYNPNSITVSYQVSRNLNEGWTVVLHEECEKDQGDFNIDIHRGGTKKKPIIQTVGIKKAANYDQKVSELKELLEREDFKKYFFNQKYEMHRFINLGITEWNNCCMDAKVSAHCLDSEMYRDCSLEDLISKFSPTSENHKRLVAESEKGDMLKLIADDRPRFIKYASLDPVFTLQVALKIKEELQKDQKSLNYFVNFAQPIENELLFEIERNGVLVDREKIPVIKQKLDEEMELRKEEFKKYCPPYVYHKHKDNFKMTRTIILQEALFKWRDTKLSKNQTEPEIHDYGFNHKPIVMNQKSGTPSTDKKAVIQPILEGKYPKKVKKFVAAHQEWSELNKLKTNYVKNIEELLTNKNRLHPSISITFTSSGRSGTRRPALQTIPKRGKSANYIRQLFICPTGQKLVKCDYEVSELRWVGQVAKDPKMIEIFRQGKDPHKITGLKLKGLSEDENIDPAEMKKIRQGTKPVNFGLVYGLQPNSLKKYAKQSFGVDYTFKEAREFYDKFFLIYHGIPKWHERSKRLLYKNGYLRTVFGRKRVLPNAYSDDEYKRMEAERTGINCEIQGPSSDATLLGGYGILNDPRVKREECKIVLFIHDELVFNIDADKLDYYLPIIQEHMTKLPTEKFGFKMLVPLAIEAEVGDDMANVEEVPIDT